MNKLIPGILILLLGSHTTLAAPDKTSPVTVVEVVSETMREEIPLSGSAEALRESNISSRVEGLVEDVLITEGDWLDSGQKILMLDRTIAQIEIATAKAALNEANARHKDASRLKDEYQSLIATNNVSATSLASAVADEEATRANVARQRAQLAHQKELLSRHTLKAPFAGVVASKHVETGQWVKTDSSIIKLVAIDTLRIRAALPQRYFSRITKGTNARIIFDALPDQQFNGNVSSRVSVGNQNTRSFPLLIDIDNAQHKIAPGMSAKIYVELSSSQSESLLIPRDAIVVRADGSRIVWRVNEKDDELKVTPVKILTGRALDDRIEVLESSLKTGDRIVLLGNENLRPGQTIRISSSEQ